MSVFVRRGGKTPETLQLLLLHALAGLVTDMDCKDRSELRHTLVPLPWTVHHSS
jgi:hypothetical protein